MFDSPAFDAHESVHVFHDEDSGLKAMIAIHSTALGPAAGGCRMWDYADSDAMVRDVLRLSHGMSYKNAMADLPLGGGKAVIWGKSKTDKTPELFRAFGRAVDSFHGNYWTAEDVGISPTDMALVREETRFVAGLDQGDAASGDPSPVTAEGVFRGICAAAKAVFGSSDISGRSVAVQGVGHVGADVVRKLRAAGANVFIADIATEAVERSFQAAFTVITFPFLFGARPAPPLARARPPQFARSPRTARETHRAVPRTLRLAK